MYSDHRSWVYFIVEDRKIVKIGETERPLGIPNKRSLKDYPEMQPKINTSCRLGRLRNWNDNTDGFIRKSLYSSARKNLVSIWAKKCEIIEKQYSIGGVVSTVSLASHKCQELMYLDHFKDTTGSYPYLNSGRK
jgi:hypothetical protein